MPRLVFLADSSVLIDYLDTDPSILRLASTHLGDILILDVILRETEQLTLEYCKQLGLKVIQGKYEECKKAAIAIGGLSPQDRLCLLVAKRMNAHCLTNDRALRRYCEEHSVLVLWGLELMHMLYGKGMITHKEACDVALQIQAVNPFITRSIIERFMEKLDAAGGQ